MSVLRRREGFRPVMRNAAWPACSFAGCEGIMLLEGVRKDKPTFQCEFDMIPFRSRGERLAFSLAGEVKQVQPKN